MVLNDGVVYFHITASLGCHPEITQALQPMQFLLSVVLDKSFGTIEDFQVQWYSILQKMSPSFLFQTSKMHLISFKHLKSADEKKPKSIGSRIATNHIQIA